MNNNKSIQRIKHFKAIILILAFFIGIISLFVYKKIFKKSVVAHINLEQLKEKSNIIPVAILGSGPAGLSAGIYSSRLGFKTLIIEGNKPGGQLTETSYVENWPGEKNILGRALIEKLKEHDINLGVMFLQETITSVNFSKWPFELVTNDGNKINALSVIIATGSSPRTLNIPGEKEYWGNGVTTCAICDAPFYKNKKVIVVGGGDSAAEQVLQLSPHVAHITMLVRKESLRASQAMQNRLKEIKNLTVLYNRELLKITGESNHVSSVEILDNQSKLSSTMSINGVFLAIGHIPNTSLFKNQLDMDKAGYIKVKGRSQRTSVNGVFAAGDVEDYVYMQAGIASGAGIKAALDASNFLHEIGFNSSIDKELKNRYFEPILVGESPVITINSYKELEKILSKNDVVILDFWGKHCPTCIHMLPTFDSVARKFNDKAAFLKIDIDQAKELSEKLFVLKVPTFIVFKKGQIIARYHNFMDKNQMIEFVGKFIN